MDNYGSNLSNKVVEKFYCEKCDYYTSKKFNYDKHNTTRKHLGNNNKIINIEDLELDKNNTYNCECGKKYTYIQGLYKHKKLCYKNKKNENIIKKNENIIQNNKKIDAENIIINHLIKQNMSLITTTEEFKIMMAEQNKMMLEIANKAAAASNVNNTINNVSNQQFNLNLFLNETCKDAMNLSDFIENLHVSMEDMEKTGELGFAKGMSRIIMNNLNAIDVCKRPIHCSDVKRETLYVKHNGVWEKEDEERKRTKEIIYKVSCLNEKQLIKWRDLPRNKGYDKSDHTKNDEFMNLVMEINKLRNEEIDKVITSISKHVAIDKDRVKMSGYLN
jgi:hypothetical protein